MASRIYPMPKALNADATAAWFRRQMAAHPRLFQPRRVPIRTWPTKERRASQRVECQTSRSQTEEYQTSSPKIEPSVMAAAEVIYWLRRCRYDRSRRVPIARVAAASGLSRMTLYRAMAGDTSEATCAALTPVLRAVADGAIGFERRRWVWEPVEHYPPALETGAVTWQDRMVRAADWQPGGRCRSCSEEGRYVLVKINGRGEWFVCDRCIGETDRRMMGAVETRRRSV
jgi:DNA-binding phage protein